MLLAIIYLPRLPANQVQLKMMAQIGRLQVTCTHHCYPSPSQVGSGGWELWRGFDPSSIHLWSTDFIKEIAPGKDQTITLSKFPITPHLKHVVPSCCALMLCMHVVSSCCALMLCMHVVSSCCVLMLCPHVVSSCCALMLCPHVVPSCCALMLRPHVVSSCCALMLRMHVVSSCCALVL